MTTAGKYLVKILQFLKVYNVLVVRSVSGDTLYTLSEAWSGVDWADLMAAQGAAPLGPIFMTGLYSVQSIVPTIVLVDLS